MASNPEFVTNYRVEEFQFTDTFSTRPRLLFKGGATAAYSASDPTIYRAGGSRIHAINISTNDAANNTLTLFKATLATNVANMGTASFATNNTITRSTGSFVTDNWAVGQRLFVGPVSPASVLQPTTPGNGQLVTITTVAATTLTVSGTPFAGTPETIPTGFALWRLNTLCVLSVPLNAGFASGVPAVSGLQPAILPFLDESPNRFLTFGANDYLAGAVGTAMGTGEVMDIEVYAGDY